MANISDLILKQVTAAAGNVEIPSAVKDQDLGGLADTVLGSLTQTATKAGGIDQITQLVTGKVSAASSPVTALAGSLFSKYVLGGLNLGSSANAISALVPAVMGNLSNIIKDQDGDGDIDLNDLLITLKGGNKSTGGAGLLGSVASGLVGSLFGKK